MPRMPLTPENKAEVASDYPKLLLDKGERARVLLFEAEPWFAFTHTLKMPIIGQDGKAAMVTVNTRDGDSREEMDMEFKGRHICLGDLETVLEKGLDPTNCPECRESVDSGGAIPPPERRFATNIVRYGCRPGTFEVAEPFQVSILAWTFNDRMANKLIEKKVEWGDLLRHDLLLGPCMVKQFQNFDIDVGQHAAWLTDAQVVDGKTQLGPRGQLVVAAFKEQKAKDLEGIIGRKVTAEQMEEDIAVVLRRWSRIRGGTAQPDTPSTSEMASAIDVGSLLGEGSAAVAAAPAPAPAQEVAAPIEIPSEPGVPVELVPTPAAAAATSGPADGAEPEAVTVPAPAEPQVGTDLDLDSLLKGI